MDSQPHDDTHDDARRVPIDVVEVDGAALAGQVLDRLDRAQTEAGVPLIDEVEHHRLVLAADGAPPPAWRACVAVRGGRGGRMVGYGAVATTVGEGARSVVGDLAPFPGPGRWTDVLPPLAGAMHRIAGEQVASEAGQLRPRLQVWVRQVDPDALTAVLAQGFALDRRLGVLGRHLSGAVAVPGAPPGITVRGVRTGDDDDGVVAVLAAAYEGTGDGGWNLGRLRERYALPWFRPEDLLVAADEDGALVGLMWLKRRDVTTGEIYNLAVHPHGQGRGLGPFLLGTGLEHLRTAGLDEVLLWVDLANARAADLYHEQGFTTRWEDVALGRDLTG